MTVNQNNSQINIGTSEKLSPCSSATTALTCKTDPAHFLYMHLSIRISIPATFIDLASSFMLVPRPLHAIYILPPGFVLQRSAGCITLRLFGLLLMGGNFWEPVCLARAPGHAFFFYYYNSCARETNLDFIVALLG